MGGVWGGGAASPLEVQLKIWEVNCTSDFGKTQEVIPMNAQSPGISFVSTVCFQFIFTLNGKPFHIVKNDGSLLPGLEFSLGLWFE